MATTFPPVISPQGTLEPIFTGVHLVWGSVQMAPLVRITRNMVVVAHDGELTLIGAVRLAPDEEKRLEALGEVKHLVKLGTHGMDDPYYRDRYGAKLWALPKARLPEGVVPDEVLAVDHLPIPDAQLFVFEHTKAPEGALILDRDGGVLLTCDSVQHWTTTAGCSPMAKVAARFMGFMKPAQIGPPWRKAMTPEGGSLRPDFERLVEAPFTHLVGAHGGVLRDDAKARLAETLTRVYGA
ncbi:MAG: hypothetical protein EP329_04980 [Deltaproteobacteria bacterium]|nr:MAG: hypothetical protein EP329_04980 [Deltaproteobacteria bacterium]